MNNALSKLLGVPCYVHNIKVQFRFPKSKKRRIRKKWAKRACNRKPDNRIFKTLGAFYMNQYTLDRCFIELTKCHPPILDPKAANLIQTNNSYFNA